MKILETNACNLFAKDSTMWSIDMRRRNALEFDDVLEELTYSLVYFMKDVDEYLVKMQVLITCAHENERNWKISFGKSEELCVAYILESRWVLGVYEFWRK